MLQIIIVVFREILEIALITGILFVASKNINHHRRWILSGLLTGVFCSFLLAFFTDRISESLEGTGQELFNAMVLLCASILISWTVLWMQKHAKTISGELKELSKKVLEGKKPLYALFVVIWLSTLREGAEIVLFTYSSYIAGLEIVKIISGLVIGITLGAIVGFMFYLGILKIFGKYFFMVTTWLLVFLSSAILAQSMAYFSSADIIPTLTNPIWDSSSYIAQKSFIGQILNIFFGYIERPSTMQVIAYFSNLALLIIGLKLFSLRIKKNNRAKSGNN